MFLNELFEPYGNQWKFLESVQRIKTDDLAALIHEVAPEGTRSVSTLACPKEMMANRRGYGSPSRRGRKLKSRTHCHRPFV